MSQTELFDKNAPTIMHNLITAFGITAEDAAAILGNGGHESAGFTEMEQIHGSALGGWQWDGTRKRSYIHFCDLKALKPFDIAASVAFLMVELRGSFGIALHLTKAAKSLFAKVEAFEYHYEMAGVPALRSRYQWAERALAAYHAAYNVPKPES